VTKRKKQKMYTKVWWGNLKEEYPGCTCEESIMVDVKELRWMGVEWILLRIGIRNRLL
jgi:hypothetical protein